MIQLNIKVNLDPLESVFTFPYLGCTIAYDNRNCDSLYQNLRKEKRCWVVVLGVLVKVGLTVWVREMFYNSVVQEVLLYGSYIWVIMD